MTKPTGGSPEHLLQDQSRDLSRALAGKPDAPLHAREAALQSAWNAGYKHGAWQAQHCAAHPQPAPLTDAVPVLKRAADWMRDKSGCCALKGIACRCSGDCSVIAVHKEVTEIIAVIKAERGIVPAPTTDTKGQP
jgi:hypothetical protein